MSDDEGFGNEYVDYVEDDIEYLTEDEFDDDQDEDKPVEEIELNEDDKEKDEDENEETIIELDKVEEEDESEKKNYEKVEQDKRVSFPFLTKYEKARLIGVRATQLSQGAKSNLETEDIWDPIKIAELELKNKCIPLIVRRYLPNGKFEDWSINELIIF